MFYVRLRCAQLAESESINKLYDANTNVCILVGERKQGKSTTEIVCSVHSFKLEQNVFV